MARLEATIEFPGFEQALAAMGQEAVKQAEFIVRQASETAALTAWKYAPSYPGVERTSRKPTGERYVQRGLLRDQIHGDTVVQEDAAYGLTGLLPADGKGDRMVPYWQLQNDGQLTPAGPRTIRPIPGHRTTLRFPSEAWATKQAECPQGYRTQRGWTFYWVRWPARAPARHFMERGFEAGRERAEAALELGLEAVANRWAA